MNPRALAVVLCSLGALAGCGGAETLDPVAHDEPVATYTGRIAGSDAVFAVLAGPVDVALYVCGGPTTYSAVSHWFSGSREAGSAHVSLTSDEGATAELTLEDETLAGRVEDPTGELGLRADRAPEDGISGLYGALDAGCRTGVVVWREEGAEAASVQGTWCSDTGIFAQVTPIAPVESPADVASGLAVSVVSVSPDVPERQLVVFPVVPTDLR